jgi:hypothetical protein
VLAKIAAALRRPPVATVEGVAGNKEANSKLSKLA